MFLDTDTLSPESFNDDMFDMETGTFGLPLKAHHDLKSNFGELEDDINGWVSIPGSRSISPTNINNHILSTRPKRVRFTTRGEDDSLIDDIRSSNNSSHIGLASRRPASAMSNISSFSTLQPTQNKRSVEQLLFTASELNAYVEKNKDNIKLYRTQVMNNDSFYNSMSDISSPMVNPKNTESMSNFILTDVEDDGEDDIDDTLDYNRIIAGSPVDALSRRSRSPINLDLSLEEDDDETHQLHNFDTDCEVDDEELGKAILHKVQEQQSTRCHADCHLLDCTCFPLIDANLISSTDLIANTIEESINNFIEAITIILKLSKDGEQDEEQELLPREHRKFLMKNTPSLSFQDFIKRIQTKCELNPTIYMCATYLLQCLFLNKEENTDNDNNPPCLKLKRDMLNNGVHRLIIALIRISCKILEDQIYSHEYMSKVCGVSKRLLTQLESSLMTCLKNQNLMITIKKLNASVAILSEMRTICPE